MIHKEITKTSGYCDLSTRFLTNLPMHRLILTGWFQPDAPQRNDNSVQALWQAWVNYRALKTLILL